MKIIILTLIVFTFQDSWGHGGEDHSKKKSPEIVHDSLNSDSKETEEIYKKINASYLNKIKPIFRKSCFDCHSSQTTYPWYYKVPGVKQLIDSDIKEAKSHLDFSNDYPFISHDSPENDLKSIEKSVSKKTMPPKKYLWMHNNAKLSQKEVEEIKKWVKESLEALK
ncbi:MAG: heme-binding domain-containing protein [Bacteroidetes bacterium]|nr:heme-binding domain-containing protein [Bacteroidota bacterium]